jgi:hypothetical protein|tara:strand:+ start:4641 stop:4817 length:177 start_codon:yes stop_codon:yes gene_type:complete
MRTDIVEYTLDDLERASNKEVIKVLNAAFEIEHTQSEISLYENLRDVLNERKERETKH